LVYTRFWFIQGLDMRGFTVYNISKFRSVSV
jgi:hypothetical protein